MQAELKNAVGELLKICYQNAERDGYCDHKIFQKFYEMEPLSLKARDILVRNRHIVVKQNLHTQEECFYLAL